MNLSVHAWLSLLTAVLAVLLVAPVDHLGSSALELDGCNASLGLESGDIPDDAISASSTFNQASVGPQNARLKKELHGGAWCPKEQISPESYEFLEIDLRSLHVITAVATQGRFGNGHGKEFAEEYRLEYRREGMTPGWVRYRSRRGTEVFEGNSNTYTVVTRTLNPPVIADRVRLIPHTQHLRTVCLRAELYGCPWQESLVSYSMPPGDRRGTDLDLSDQTYDGVRETRLLHGGLGQLTDGLKGPDNFRENHGYDWVGWRNDTHGRTGSVELTFEFDTVRNFSMAIFYTNNAHSRDVQVFSGAKVWFSIGGQHFHREPPVAFSYMPDLFFERSRNVPVNLYHRVGRFVRFELTFAARWLMISEVSFSSVPVSGNFTEEEPPVAPPIVSTALSEDSLSNQYVGLVIGVLAAVILLLILAIFVIVARNRHRRKAAATPHGLKSSDRVTINMKDLGLSYSPCPPLLTTNSNLYGHVTPDPEKLLYQEPLDYKLYSSAYTNGHFSSADSTTSREYAVPDVTKGISPSGKYVTRGHYATADIQGSSGATTYAVPELLVGPDTPSPLREIPRHRLHILEKLGEGQFGEIHLCEVEGVPELVDVPAPPGGTSKTLVAVKTLRPGATDQARADFLREASVLSRLRDPRIVHVIGVCSSEPPCMVVEYLDKGDLCQFLKKHVSETATFKHPSANILTYGAQIYMATQIASGMKYLESLNFVHRDLAARNCLVGRGYSIKISDFGMAQDRYARDYYRPPSLDSRTSPVRATGLPIRWMAWEAILMGKFTTKSDVWSFAVTLWEILTLGRQQPLADLSDDEVIENMGHLYHGDGRHRQLSQPAGCPREIYDLMTECWQRQDHDRPNFREIHLFLQRKNLGYTPQV